MLSLHDKYLVKCLSGERLATIGKALGMSNYSSVSSAVSRMNNEIREDARPAKASRAHRVQAPNEPKVELTQKIAVKLIARNGLKAFQEPGSRQPPMVVKSSFEGSIDKEMSHGHFIPYDL